VVWAWHPWYSAHKAGMGVLSSRFGGSPSVLAAPVRFENARIETVSHVRSAGVVGVLRRLKRLLAAKLHVRPEWFCRAA
jgi:hypothetical protein